MYDWINTLSSMEVQQLIEVNTGLTIATMILTACGALMTLFTFDEYKGPSKFCVLLTLVILALSFYIPSDDVLTMASNYKAPVPQANMSHMVRMIHVR